MKTGLLSILAVLMLFSASFAQCTNVEKYDANKKSPLGAAVLQLFVPGAGNDYSSESIVKVIAYPTLFVGFAAVGAIGSISSNKTNDKVTWLFVGGIGAAITHFIGIADATIGSVHYNDKLRRKYDLVLDEKGIQLVYKF